MAIFLCLSPDDADASPALVAAARKAEFVTLPDDPAAPDMSWQELLGMIRDCDVFVAAVSSRHHGWAVGEREVDYARRTDRPMLAVQLDDTQVDATLWGRTIDFRQSNQDRAVDLISALYAMRVQASPLPTPLPEEPAAPLEYGVFSPSPLSPREQRELLAELRRRITESGQSGNPGLRDVDVLQRLHDRAEVTLQVRNASAELLAAYPPARPHPAPAGNARRWSCSRGMVAAGAVVAVIAIIAATLAIIRPWQGDEPPLANVTSPQLLSALLAPREIGQLAGVDDMRVQFDLDTLDPAASTPDHPECIGSQHTGSDAFFGKYQHTGVHTQRLIGGPVDKPEPIVFQTVVALSSPDEAQRAANDSARDWDLCGGRSVRVQVVDEDLRWYVKPVVRNGESISQESLQEGGNDWMCRHELTPFKNLIAEARACGFDVGDTARRVVDGIVERASGLKPPSATDQDSREPTSAMMLAPEEAAALLDYGELTLQWKYDTFGIEQQMRASLPDCYGTGVNAGWSTYAGSDFREVTNQRLEAVADSSSITESVTRFVSPEAAVDLHSQTESSWSSCAGRTQELVSDTGEADRWDIGELTRRDGAITTESTLAGSDGWKCQHTQKLVAEFVVEAMACGPRVTNQAEIIAGALAEKVDR